MKLYSATQMVAADQYAISTLGLPGAVLMESAGRACAERLHAEFASCFPGPLLIVAGKGNNGGDGYVIARILADRGWQVTTLVLAAAEAIRGDAAIMLRVLENCGQQVVFVEEEQGLQDVFATTAATVIVDAIFGTGLQAAVRGLPAAAINMINGSGAAVVAVDIPSGVDGSNGRICGIAVQADLTVTFDHAKIGHGSYPGAGYVGKLEVVDIGIPHRARPSANDAPVQLIDFRSAQALLPLRTATGHKGRFGHLLVVAGSPGKSGAAALAGNAAVRSGCGLVTVAVPASIHDILEVKLTEGMTLPLADDNGLLTAAALPQLLAFAQHCQALAVGPGLGQSEALRLLMRQLISHCSQPLIIDADGLNLLQGQLECLTVGNNRALVLTPHPGEMARLTGLTVEQIEADRFCVAREFARQHGVVVLLKGVRTLVAAADGRMNINATGNSGLASGGSGDVLTGLLGGLLAQGVDPFAAASLAAWIHGRAAELIAAQRGVAGMAASELIHQLPVARRELEKGVCLC